MGWLNQVVGAVSEQGGLGQIGGLVNTVQQLSNDTGADEGQMRSLLSVVANFSQSALKEQEPDQAQNLVNQYSGLSANPLAVQALFSLPQLQNLIQVAADKTGLPASTIESVLPTAVPLVLKVVEMGASQAEKNPVLSRLLDADGDGDIDIADLMQLASRYL
ncbi:DUF937 domain-containing protein [Roseofilum capinflatum]|uniref:DUF937 domain-containing protein n=1 Tax=Roseofilum capinflatum BLCC-M114 TaxID=3022440 RepID=A0ABT7BAU5_9CYAN|nr:DUF937 domain-containing protein [Roseofilum capinflatum]MDJ1176266.1 DUF937 domain-containing protein [Roseofilum capinflatum BLCC-M114]